MRNPKKLFAYCLLAMLAFVLPASAEEIAGQWHALFDTPGGVQTYHFDFQENDGKLITIFKKHEEAIERVTFWGLNDRRTSRRGQHPLLFDANNNTKPAYASIVELAGGKPTQ
ncbi:endo-1,4-beta-xylanase [Stieleria marina]|uniref:Endo-1,4-beta-xylanase A n=1 Tax=Stieleria marina TaxID=1930275 RepID=A0A517NXY1_9BACT|nr:Endo-1,4-beta-xylanase A precursor [Planctomycetes bacterium K23_9]